MPVTSGVLMAVVAALLLLLVSGAVSGAEVAYFSLSANDLNELKEINSRKLNIALTHLKTPEMLLATILITNNFVNIGVVIASTYISKYMFSINASPLFEFLIKVVFITAILLFFGEILPKVYAGRNKRRVVGLMAYPLLVMKKLTLPLAAPMVRSTNIVNKRLTKHLKNKISLDDISQAIDLTGDELNEEKEILKKIVTFGNINVSEIMTGRVDVIDIDINSDFSKVIAVIVESGYSRIPVYEGSPDNVRGVLYVKDMLPHIDKDNKFEWKKLIRTAYYVPETKRINDLLQEFKTKKIHIAIVVDEYGGTSGIVTLEDILEEIVGEIQDETDDDETKFSVQPDGSYIFEGKTLLKDFFRITKIAEQKFEKIIGEAETIAGLLLELKGEIPTKNEVIEFNNVVFTILSANNRQIKKIKFNVKPSPIPKIKP
jgi:gliding motility-associated protein GldE